MMVCVVKSVFMPTKLAVKSAFMPTKFIKYLFVHLWQTIKKKDGLSTCRYMR